MDEKLSRRVVAVGAVASAAVAVIGARTVRASVPVHEIMIKSFKFDPESIVVEVGDVIRWTNQDLAPHTATADEGGWDTGRMRKGESADIVVTPNMETSYFCVFHRRMKGAIEII